MTGFMQNAFLEKPVFTSQEMTLKPVLELIWELFSWKTGFRNILVKFWYFFEYSSLACEMLSGKFHERPDLVSAWVLKKAAPKKPTICSFKILWHVRRHSIFSSSLENNCLIIINSVVLESVIQLVWNVNVNFSLEKLFRKIENNLVSVFERSLKFFHQIVIFSFFPLSFRKAVCVLVKTVVENLITVETR